MGDNFARLVKLARLRIRELLAALPTKENHRKSHVWVKWLDSQISVSPPSPVGKETRM